MGNWRDTVSRHGRRRECQPRAFRAATASLPHLCAAPLAQAVVRAHLAAGAAHRYEGRYKANAPQPMTLTDYVAAHIDACAPGLVCPYYIFSDRFTRGDTVVSVKDEALTPLPSWAVGRVQASNPPQFYIGGAHTGAPMHFHQAAFNVLVHGRKLWFVTVPKHAVFSMRPAHEWIAERLPVRAPRRRAARIGSDRRFREAPRQPPACTRTC